MLMLSLFVIACEGTSGSISIGSTANSNNNNTSDDDNNTLTGGNTTLTTDNNILDSDNDSKANSEDSCPTGQTNWKSNTTTDRDDDGCRDRDEDRDDDGDGLVDILNADELSMITADLAVEGCGNGRNITCHGYELTANISLSAHTGGWQPIGKDHCQRKYQPMQLLFDGNGFFISDMVIVQSSEDCLGLFGNIGGEVRNLNLQRMTISSSGEAVGILAGRSHNLTIADVSVVSSSLTGSKLVGGLIGDGSNITIHSSQVNINISNSGELIGGLMGESHNTTIINTSVVAGRIDGIGKIGGLIGEGSQVTMINTSVAVRTIEGGIGAQVGGMIGFGERITIIQGTAIANNIIGMGSSIGGLAGSIGDSMVRGTHVIANNITGSGTGSGDIGGLLGITGNTEVVSSLVFVKAINGTGSNIGGLIGQVSSDVDIIASYAVVHSVAGSSTSSYIGGLVGGERQRIDIASSYAIANTVHGNSGFIGGLAGAADQSTITSSYVLAEVPQGGGLVGEGSRITINNTYWHDISSLAAIATPTNILHINPNNNLSLAELSNPTQYDMTIYDSWDDHSTGIDKRHIWCDSNFDGHIDSSEMVDDNRIWNFGTSNDYPAIRCTPDTIVEQRRRWSIDQGKPSFNRTLLDQLLSF